MFTKTAAAIFVAASLVAAAPTGTTNLDERTPTWTAPKVTHTVVAGRAGLNFEPNNIFAAVGEIVEFHFLKVNHSVAQSSFSKPCVPGGADVPFFGGFNFFVPEGKTQAEKVFQIEVTSTKPTWFYCPQTTGDHCQKGMVGVINRDFNNNDATIDAFKALAAKAPKSEVPAGAQGGNVIVNPNPLAGV
jgi:plastocyanin